MSDDLTVPVDDAALDSLEHALDGCYEVDPDGTHRLVGAEYSLNQLLDFWSGYDPAKLIKLPPGPDPIFGQYEVEWSEYPDPILSERDVLRALIQEIRRLRSTHGSAGEE